jgi:hypothetical protein
MISDRAHSPNLRAHGQKQLPDKDTDEPAHAQR